MFVTDAYYYRGNEHLQRMNSDVLFDEENIILEKQYWLDYYIAITNLIYIAKYNSPKFPDMESKIQYFWEWFAMKRILAKIKHKTKNLEIIILGEHMKSIVFPSIIENYSCIQILSYNLPKDVLEKL